MNIYFSCSITGGREDQIMYARIVDYLLKNGHEVPTAHLASTEIMSEESTIDPVDVFHRDMEWVKKCDALIAEVSTPSHGVGYEIAQAINLGKLVMCCWKKGTKISKIISGNTNRNIHLYHYENEDDLLNEISLFLDKIA